MKTASNAVGGRFERTRLLLNRRTTLRILLVGSLLLNAFLIGTLLVWQMLPAKEQRGLLSIEVGRVVEALPERSREEVRQAVEEIMPELRQRWSILRGLRADINALVAEDEPDRTAIDAHLAEIRAISTEIQAIVQNQVFDSVLALPPSERSLTQNRERSTDR